MGLSTSLSVLPLFSDEQARKFREVVTAWLFYTPIKTGNFSKCRVCVCGERQNETELLQLERAVRSNHRLKHVFGVSGPRAGTYPYVIVFKRLIILFPLESLTGSYVSNNSSCKS